MLVNVLCVCGGGGGGRYTGRCHRQGPGSAGLLNDGREGLDFVLWAVVSHFTVHQNPLGVNSVQVTGPIPATLAQSGWAGGQGLHADKQPGDPCAHGLRSPACYGKGEPP